MWASLPTNDFGNLDYKEFLRRYSSNMEIPPTQRPASTINGRPGTQMSGRRLQSRAMSRSITQVRSLTRERVYLYSAMYPALALLSYYLMYVIIFSCSQMEFGRPGSRLSRAQSRMSTPLINAESAEARIKNRIFRNWKEIQRSCRNCDRNNTGTIQVQELKGNDRSLSMYMYVECRGKIILFMNFILKELCLNKLNIK